MNQKIKQKWIAALRSGKYKQGRYRLRVGDKYCCLGVLCRIEDQQIDFNVGLPPSEFTSDIGIRVDIIRKLVDMNDVGYSFDFIADEIEATL